MLALMRDPQVWPALGARPSATKAQHALLIAGGGKLDLSHERRADINPQPPFQRFSFCHRPIMGARSKITTHR